MTDTAELIAQARKTEGLYVNASLVLALASALEADGAERDDWKRQWESAVEDIALVQREAEAENRRLREALQEISNLGGNAMTVAQTATLIAARTLAESGDD